MTAPSKTCTRSRLPSTTRTWTLTVSPGAKSGTSSRRLAWSMRSVGCIVHVLLCARGLRGAFAAREELVERSGERSDQMAEAELLETRPLGVGEPAPGHDEVRPALDGARQRLRV